MAAMASWNKREKAKSSRSPTQARQAKAQSRTPCHDSHHDIDLLQLHKKVDEQMQSYRPGQGQLTKCEQRSKFTQQALEKEDETSKTWRTGCKYSGFFVFEDRSHEEAAAVKKPQPQP